MENIYNKFSKEYNQLFTDNIKQFQKNSIKRKNIAFNYLPFYPQFGIKHSEECPFLVYGQAINDWDGAFTIPKSELDIEKLVDASIKFSNSYYPNHCPLDWVNVHWSKSYKNRFIQSKSEIAFYSEMEYATFRSFFWNATYKLICKYFNLNEDGWEWSRKMVWSNLYKIAPPQANPNNLERELQLENSIKLVKKEIEELKPKFCIILTNNTWWKPFQKLLSTEILKHDLGPEIESYEQFNNTKIIVTTRPFLGSGEKHVAKIIELIGKHSETN